jgi:hypothetical protein
MPEAPVHENADAVAREDDFRIVWKIAAVKPEAVAHGIQQTSDKQFRLGVFAANAAYQAAALLSGKGVGHDSESCFRFSLDRVAVSLPKPTQ